MSYRSKHDHERSHESDEAILNAAIAALKNAKAELDKLYAESETNETQQAIADVLDQFPDWRPLNDVIPGGDE